MGVSIHILSVNWRMVPLTPQEVPVPQTPEGPPQQPPPPPKALAAPVPAGIEWW